MFKKVSVLGVILASIALAGCEEGTVIYEGKVQPVSTVEEIIADQLEVENPEIDLEVDIYQETED